jgi:hypothetical protein
MHGAKDGDTNGRHPLVGGVVVALFVLPATSTRTNTIVEHMGLVTGT